MYKLPEVHPVLHTETGYGRNSSHKLWLLRTATVYDQTGEPVQTLPGTRQRWSKNNTQQQKRQEKPRVSGAGRKGDYYMEIQKENRQPLKWCEYCGEAMHQDSNFCPHCSQKATKICNCWVLSKPYDCGQDECPGHGLWKILKSQKREDQAHSGCVEDNSKNGQAYRQGR